VTQLATHLVHLATHQAPLNIIYAQRGRSGRGYRELVGGREMRLLARKFGCFSYLALQTSSWDACPSNFLYLGILVHDAGMGGRDETTLNMSSVSSIAVVIDLRAREF